MRVNAGMDHARFFAKGTKIPNLEIFHFYMLFINAGQIYLPAFWQKHTFELYHFQFYN